MKRLLLSTALAASLAMGGCATTSSTDVAAEVAQAQQIAVNICGYLPAATTVSAIIATFVPEAGPINDLATQVATAICSAVTKPSAANGLRATASAPKVNGVPIKGKFVR